MAWLLRLDVSLGESDAIAAPSRAIFEELIAIQTQAIHKIVHL